MKLTFLGAAKSVTGSSTLLEIEGKKILIDCGLVQGSDEREIGNDIKFDVSDIDALILTHAHIDHSGRIPLLVKKGFRGPIYATPATIALCRIMLDDSAHIQEMETSWHNRKARRSGAKLIEPLYVLADVNQSLKQAKPCDYEKEYKIGKDVSFTLVDAGHLFGSSSVIIKGEGKTIVFSGDIGNGMQPLINDPTYIDNADFVVMESTYGDRLHEDSEDVNSQEEMSERNARLIADLINECFSNKGNLIIPSFSVGRTQEVLYLINMAMRLNLLDKSTPIYVDSPLSSKATKVFQKYLYQVADKQAMALINKNIDPITFDSLRFTKDVNESKRLNADKTSKVIISSSGMCTAGRIKHHLKHNLYRRESTILFTGYQASGTLGRALIDRNPSVKIFGETIKVRAKIVQMHTLSGHADKNGLLKWLDNFKSDIKMVFINHGGKHIAPYFASYITGSRGIPAKAASLYETYDLDNYLKIKKADAISTSYTRTYEGIHEDLIDKKKGIESLLANLPNDNLKDQLVQINDNLSKLLKELKEKIN